jgi:GTP pyrophosphokinase
MENKASFFARLEPRLAPSELVRVRGAYYLAKYGHRAQVRKELGEDGNPLRYFEHVRRVALVLMDEARLFDPDLVCTALLHDALEDTEDIDALIVEQMFGRNVARRVRLLTKEPKEGYLDRLAQADTETLLIKACDRLDNLRSLAETSEEFRQKQVRETVEKYLPLFEMALGANVVILRIKDILRGLSRSNLET